MYFRNDEGQILCGAVLLIMLHNIHLGFVCDSVDAWFVLLDVDVGAVRTFYRDGDATVT